MTDSVQRKAAEAIARQAERTASRATANQSMPQGEGWAMSCGLVPHPIHTARMREAEQLYAQAAALYPEGFWIHQRALLLMDLGDFDEAIQCIEACAAQGYYPLSALAQSMISQCRMLQQNQTGAGEAKSEARKTDWLKQQMKQSLAQLNPGLATLMEQAWDEAAQMTAAAETFDNDEDDESSFGREPLTEEECTRVCEFAEDFGWALVDGHYAKAHAMLGPNLRAEISVEDLQKEYEEMVSYAELPIDCVDAMPPGNDMPDMSPEMLAWVMVYLSSDDIREAVTLDVSQLDGDVLCITALEWGRP